MDEAGCHCPFLNRADERCADRLNLSQLDYAYRYCFDAYKRCSVYVELLAERRIKRLSAAVVKPGHEDQRFIQLSISHRNAQREVASLAPLPRIRARAGQ